MARRFRWTELGREPGIETLRPALSERQVQAWIKVNSRKHQAFARVKDSLSAR